MGERERERWEGHTVILIYHGKNRTRQGVTKRESREGGKEKKRKKGNGFE